MELLILEELSKCGSFIFLSFVGDDTDGWGPLLELGDPVLNSDQGHNDQERPFVTFVADQVSKQTDGLDCLSKSHLICKDAIKIVIVKRDHPIETDELVRLQQSACEQMRLRVDGLFD